MAAKRTVKKGRPGTFCYLGGYVYECDNNGAFRPRRDLGPGYVGAFRHKYYDPKKAKNGAK